jgi:hypothetical protein
MTAPMVWVWDVASGRSREVPVAEAVAGMVRYGRSLGEPSPAACVAISRALAFARAHGVTNTTP